MIYDPFSGALYASDGTYLKTLQCPMSTQKVAMMPFAKDSLDRHCLNCGETVHSLDELSDVEIKELLAYEPDACVYATSVGKNFVVLQHPDWLKKQLNDGKIRPRSAIAQG
jgi:hypothetical protein